MDLPGNEDPRDFLLTDNPHAPLGALVDDVAVEARVRKQHAPLPALGVPAAVPVRSGEDTAVRGS